MHVVSPKEFRCCLVWILARIIAQFIIYSVNGEIKHKVILFDGFTSFPLVELPLTKLVLLLLLSLLLLPFPLQFALQSLALRALFQCLLSHFIDPFANNFTDVVANTIATSSYLHTSFRTLKYVDSDPNNQALPRQEGLILL